MIVRWVRMLLGSLILWSGLAVVAQPAAAQGTADSAAITVTATPFFQGAYRSGDWLPVRVTVANSGPDIDAIVSVNVGSSYEAEIELPRDANKSLVIYALPVDAFRRSAAVRVLVDGVEVKKTDISLEGVTSGAQVIGTIAEQPLSMPLPRGTAQSKVLGLTLTRDQLPDRGEGLSLFDALIVDGAPLPDLSAPQQQALADWVRSGGQLIIGGSKLEQTLSQIPEPLRIATPGEPATPAALSIAPEIKDAPSDLRAIIGSDGTRTLVTAGATNVGVRGEFGAGSVTVLGFTMAAPELSQLTTQSSFWSQLLRPRVEAPGMFGMPSRDDMQMQQIGFALTALPVLAHPPLGLLIGILTAYILIVGPGLYFVLRKLDRQVWGWVAIPLITLLFALGSYGYGLRIRGDDIILNQISIVEPVNGRAHVRSYAGVFSPSTTTYQVSSTSDALFKPMIGDPNGGMPVQTIGGRFTQGSSGVRDLSVDQWSMNMFAAETTIDGSPLTAEVTLNGDLLRGSVRNTGSMVLRDVALFQNTRVAKVGDLQPGESKQVELKLTNTVSTDWTSTLPIQLLRDKWDFNKPMAPPADVRMRQSILEAMFNLPYGRSPQPTAIGWMDTSPVDMSLGGGRVKQQRTTLVTAPATVSYSAGQSVSLPRGWISTSSEVSGSSSGGPCIMPFGTGWYLDTGVMTSTLQLPPALQHIAVDEATLFVQTEGALPDPATLELYDWSGESWVAQQQIKNQMPLDQPQRFFSDGGSLRLRLQLQNAMQKGSGCITTDVSVKGTQR